MAEKQRLVVNDLGNLPEVAPAAEPRFLDSYMRPGVSEIGRPPQVNPMMQLSDALGKLEPSLLRATDMAQTQISEEEYAKAKSDFFGPNREKWNAIIKSGQIPEGLSPYYVRGLQRASLDQHGEMFYSQVHTDFYGEAGAEARQSNNPAVMQKFLNDARTKFVQENLKNGDKDLYSPLDMHEVFGKKAEQAFGAMMKTHVAYRVAEQEKEYEALATVRIENALERNLSQIHPNDSDDIIDFYIKQAAAETDAVLYDPDKGAVKNGMLASKGSQILIDTITTKMISTGKRVYGDVLDHIKTKDGASIGKTQYAQARRQAAEEHLTNREIQKEHLDRARSKYKHEDKAIEHTEKEWERRQDNDEKEYASELRARRVFGALRMTDTTKAMDTLDEIFREAEKAGDRKGAMELRSMVSTLTKQQADYQDDPATATQLRLEISSSPLEFSVTKLSKAVSQKLLTVPTMFKMIDDLERNRQNGDHPFLKQPFFHRLTTEISGAMADKYGETEFGEGSIRKGEALTELHDEANTWLSENPEGKHSEFTKYLQGIKKDLIERHNSAFGAEQKRKAEDEQKKGQATVDKTKADVAAQEQAKAKKEAPEKARREREEKERVEVEKNNSTYTDSGKKTSEGRPILQDKDGNIATEFAVTVKDKRINWGRPTNIPTIYGGKYYTEKEARDIIAKANPDPDDIRDPETGRRLRGWYSVEDAVIAARERSARLGKEYSAPKDKKPEPPKEAPKEEKKADQEASITPTPVTTSGRFLVDEGEIIDQQTREIIPMDKFEKRASAQDKIEVARFLRESGDDEED